VTLLRMATAVLMLLFCAIVWLLTYALIGAMLAPTVAVVFAYRSGWVLWLLGSARP
jgi:hypothetical protein